MAFLGYTRGDPMWMLLLISESPTGDCTTSYRVPDGVEVPGGVYSSVQEALEDGWEPISASHDPTDYPTVNLYVLRKPVA